jgi:acetoin utilization protein AcuB
MTRDPVTIDPRTFLSEAKDRMQRGKFRRLPILGNGSLVGIITDRDIRMHTGHLEGTRVSDVMTAPVLTISPSATVEEAAQILLQRQIGGLPVVEDGRLVGVITTTDVMRAFLDLMGASEQASVRIDFILEGEEHGLVEASRIVAREGGEIRGVGTYREKLSESPICYLRLVGGDADRISQALRAGGFNVMGVHRSRS